MHKKKRAGNDVNTRDLVATSNESHQIIQDQIVTSNQNHRIIPI